MSPVNRYWNFSQSMESRFARSGGRRANQERRRGNKVSRKPRIGVIRVILTYPNIPNSNGVISAVSYSLMCKGIMHCQQVTQLKRDSGCGFSKVILIRRPSGPAVMTFFQCRESIILFGDLTTLNQRPSPRERSPRRKRFLIHRLDIFFSQLGNHGVQLQNNLFRVLELPLLFQQLALRVTNPLLKRHH